jgi:hypothetical protein
VVGAPEGAGAGRRNRLALKLGVLAAAAALAGCASDTITIPDRSELDVAGLRATARVRVYWVGEEFGGLPLSYASETSVLYGTCEARGGWFSDGGCHVPIQIQQEPFSMGNWKSALGCRGLRSFRGVPAVHQKGLVLFTGSRYVMIVARSAEEELRIGRALRPLNGPQQRKLPPPAAGVEREVRNACG